MQLGSKTLGTAAVKVVAKTDDYERDINSAKGVIDEFGRETKRNLRDVDNAFSSFGSSVKKATGFLAGLTAGAGGLAYLTQQSLGAAAEMQKSATMAGVSAQAYQELSYAANQYMITQDALTDGLKELNLRAEEFAVTGEGPAKEAFERLGYSQAELNGKLEDTPALLSEIISRMEGMKQAAKMRIADEIFGGTGGEQFVAMINGGAVALDGFTEKAHAFGLVMTDEVVQGATDANRSIDNLTAQLNTQFAQVVATLAPDIGVLAQNMGDWVSQNQDFIRDDIPGFVTDIATSAGTLSGVLSDMTKNVAINAQAFGLAKEGQISWVDYITKSTNELKKMVGQFDAAHNAGVNFIEWQDELENLTEKFERLGTQIERGKDFGVLSPEGLKNLEAQQDTIAKQIEQHKALIEVKKEDSKVAQESSDNQVKTLKVKTGLIEKNRAAWLKAQKEGEEAEKKRLKESERANEQFFESHQKVTLTDAEFQLKTLDDLYDYYDGHISDKLKLEEWYSAELQKLVNTNKKAQEALSEKEEARLTKEQEATQRAAELIITATDQMYQDIGLKGEENYKYQKKLLEDQAQARKDLGVDEVLVERWKNKEIEDLERQRTLDSNNFFAGMKIGLQDSEKDFRTWAEQGQSISEEMSQGMHSAFSDSLFLALKGDLDDISQVWDGFMDSMLHKLTDTVSEMAVKWGIGAVGEVTGWWDTGAWEIKKDHVAMVHAGEMIVPADVAEIVRNGSGRDSISDLAQVSPSGGHEWAADDAKMIEGFMTGTKSSFLVGRLAQGASLAAQGAISIPDFISGIANPDALAGAVIGGGLPTGINSALGLLSDPWGVWGQRLLGSVGGMAMGPIGSVLGGVAGGVFGMMAGDISNTRKYESLSDDLEDARGWFGGLMAMSALKSSVRDFSNIDEVALALEQYDYAMKYKADLAALREPGKYLSGMWNAAYQRGIDPGWMDPDQSISPFSANPSAPSYGGGYGRGGQRSDGSDGGGYGGYGGSSNGSDNDNSGIGGWADGGVIDKLMVPYGEDGWAAVQFGEGVVSKKGMEALAKINAGNLEKYPEYSDDMSTTISITNNIQSAVLDTLGKDLSTELKLQTNGVILEDMSSVVELFNLILADGIEPAELESAYQSFIGLGLATEDAAVATKLLIDEYGSQEKAAEALQAKLKAASDEVADMRISLSDLVTDLEYSSLAPVQSMDYYNNRYQTALNNLTSATTEDELSAATTALTKIVPDYLDYAQDYGGNYKSVYDAVRDTLKNIEITSSSQTSVNPEITVVVKIGEKTVENMTVDVLNNSPEAQKAVERITA